MADRASTTHRRTAKVLHKRVKQKNLDQVAHERGKQNSMTTVSLRVKGGSKSRLNTGGKLLKAVGEYICSRWRSSKSKIAVEMWRENVFPMQTRAHEIA